MASALPSGMPAFQKLLLVSHLHTQAVDDWLSLLSDRVHAMGSRLGRWSTYWSAYWSTQQSPTTEADPEPAEASNQGDDPQEQVCPVQHSSPPARPL